jgi:hypothetical protein
MYMTTNPVDKQREWVGGIGTLDETVSAGDTLGKYVQGGDYVHKIRSGEVNVGKATESMMPGTKVEEFEFGRWREKREKWEPPAGAKKVTYT